MHHADSLNVELHGGQSVQLSCSDAAEWCGRSKD